MIQYLNTGFIVLIKGSIVVELQNGTKIFKDFIVRIIPNKSNHPVVQ